jgi:hypothetical protein
VTRYTRAIDVDTPLRAGLSHVISVIPS